MAEQVIITTDNGATLEVRSGSKGKINVDNIKLGTNTKLTVIAGLDEDDYAYRKAMFLAKEALRRAHENQT